MPISLTPDQILALAPDSASAKAGKGLATVRKWQALGYNERAVWGECQGSGSVPYQTQVDLSEPAFRCSCPSRKFPCKHGVGLLLLLVGESGAFAHGVPPAWVAEWLAKRDARQTPSEVAASAASPENQRRRAAARERSAATREARVAAGVEDLGRWLRDLVRQGLAEAQRHPHAFWDAAAARMVDAQAPGLARLLRELSGVAASGEGWQARLLERLARLHVLIEGFTRLEVLPPHTQADIRTVFGWTQSQEELLSADGVRDHWLVLGQRTEDEEALRVQRTWLWGARTARPALVLAFAAPGQPLDRSLIPGTALDAEVVFFPSAYPLRALIKQRASPLPLRVEAHGFVGLDAAYAAYAAALACVPWLERFPLLLRDVVPVRHAAHWVLRDREDQAVPIAPAFQHGWRLLAISGGHPLSVFGEWDGEVLLPFSAFVAGEYRRLSSE